MKTQKFFFTKSILPVFALLVGLHLHGAPAQAAPSGSIARQLGTEIADAVEHVMPGVVVIRTRETRYRLAQDWFFGQFEIPEHLAGQGSGMIISKDGYVLTNNHVVDSADEIQVVLPDGLVLPATLVGRDFNTDLAVLKIDSDREFPTVNFADSDRLRVGEFVIAIGSPFSLQSTVTLGTVSQIGRTFGAAPFVDYIQTDAAINRGNSGGPLIDVDGNVIGVNTFIQTASPYSGGSIGIGFAVPAKLARKVTDSIIATGKSQLPWIGVVMRTEEEGVRIMRVAEDGPAGRGGLEPGDLILKVGETDIQTTMDVKRAVQNGTVGDKLLIQVDRDPGPLDLEVIPEALPDLRSIMR